jgi:hypothetical protein
MAKKQSKPADAAKDKAAKQKKMAIGLICLLAVAMAYAVHTMMGLNGGAPSSKPQAADPSAAATTNPTATASPAPVAPTLAGAQPVADPAAAAAVGASATGSTQLLAAVSAPADAGQLLSFSRFESKDPFARGTGSGSGSTSGGGGSGSGSGSGGTSGSKPAAPPVVPPAPPVPPPSSALISVNGLSELVSTGGSFPTTSPSAGSNGLFELRSLTAKTAKVSVVGGSYASGSQTLTLTVNKPVTLVNTADGTRYTLVLYPQGTTAPAAPAGGSSGSSSPPATTPAAPATPTTTPTTTTPSSGG